MRDATAAEAQRSAAAEARFAALSTEVRALAAAADGLEGAGEAARAALIEKLSASLSAQATRDVDRGAPFSAALKALQFSLDEASAAHAAQVAALSDLAARAVGSGLSQHMELCSAEAAATGGLLRALSAHVRGECEAHGAARRSLEGAVDALRRRLLVAAAGGGEGKELLAAQREASALGRALAAARADAMGKAMAAAAEVTALGGLVEKAVNAAAPLRQQQQQQRASTVAASVPAPAAPTQAARVASVSLLQEVASGSEDEGEGEEEEEGLGQMALLMSPPPPLPPLPSSIAEEDGEWE